jgi:hypothetical protein
LACSELRFWRILCSFFLRDERVFYEEVEREKADTLKKITKLRTCISKLIINIVALPSKHATFGIGSGRIFDRLLDFRSHCLVISPHFGDASGTGNAESNVEKADADRKADRQTLNEINANAKVNREQIMADQIADRECMKQMMARTDENQEKVAINLKEMETDSKRGREDLKKMMFEINDKMEDNQAEMRSTICAFRSELQDTIKREMRTAMQSVRSELEKITAYNKARETGPDPEMMQSIEEHQEAP